MIFASFMFILGLLTLMVSLLTLYKALSSTTSRVWEYNPFLVGWILIAMSSQYIWG